MKKKYFSFSGWTEKCNFAKYENFQVLPGYGSSDTDSCAPGNSSYSSDENNDLLSYHKNDESGDVSITPLHSDEDESDTRYCAKTTIIT